MKYPVITGPTASGKTALAVALASDLDGEIISADSRQIYTGMDIGTGKDLEEYGSVPYHLIDIAPAGYKYNLFEYLRDAREAMDNILARGKVPVVCGAHTCPKFRLTKICAANSPANHSKSSPGYSKQ